jgi:hypothetical protein
VDVAEPSFACPLDRALRDGATQRGGAHGMMCRDPLAIHESLQLGSGQIELWLGDRHDPTGSVR